MSGYYLKLSHRVLSGKHSFGFLSSALLAVGTVGDRHRQDRYRIVTAQHSCCRAEAWSADWLSVYTVTLGLQISKFYFIMIAAKNKVWMLVMMLGRRKAITQPCVTLEWLWVPVCTVHSEEGHGGVRER